MQNCEKKTQVGRGYSHDTLRVLNMSDIVIDDYSRNEQAPRDNHQNMTNNAGGRKVSSVKTYRYACLHPYTGDRIVLKPSKFNRRLLRCKSHYTEIIESIRKNRS